MSASVRRTDCGTGWMVLRADGSWYLTVRSHESAVGIARELDAQEAAHVDSDGGMAEPFGRAS